MSGNFGDRWNLTVQIHVWPIDDLVEHTLTEDCVCLPEIDDSGRLADGKKVFEYVHHALDQRELFETA